MAAYNGLIDLSTKRIRVLTAEAGERRDAPRLMRREEPSSMGLRACRRSWIDWSMTAT